VDTALDAYRIEDLGRQMACEVLCLLVAAAGGETQDTNMYDDRYRQYQFNLDTEVTSGYTGGVFPLRVAEGLAR
jgi:hypothetical protein